MMVQTHVNNLQHALSTGKLLPRDALLITGAPTPHGFIIAEEPEKKYE